MALILYQDGVTRSHETQALMLIITVQTYGNFKHLFWHLECIWDRIIVAFSLATAFYAIVCTNCTLLFDI
jgi:hypothetical protein